MYPVFIRIGFERLEVAKHPILKETNRMNTHKHARLTFARRLQMVRQMTEGGLSACEAAAEHGVTPPTARKWLGRYLAGGSSALADASSRPMRSPRSIDPAKALLIVELRRRRMLQSRIARSVGVSESTVSRVLARAGLSRLSDFDPVEPVVRYEHEAPGDLLHIDTKKLGRIVRPSHRVTGISDDSAGLAAPADKQNMVQLEQRYGSQQPTAPESAISEDLDEKVDHASVFSG